MSDINPNRMIPLHVADQAVAACNAEIEHWKEQWHFVIQDNNKQMDEIAALKDEVQRLKHRAEGLREAGDELWFCLRHTKSLSHAEIQEAVEDWQYMRDAK